MNATLTLPGSPATAVAASLRPLPVPAGSAAALAPAEPAADFDTCYRQQLPGLVWFVMSLGATAEEAADAAQAAFTAAFPVWDTIRHPQAWLRRVAQRAHCRRRTSREIPVEAAPEHAGPLTAAGAVELRAEAREVLAALAALPPGQRQVMAWHVDGFSPAEIARELGTSQAAVRQSLAKARRNLKRQLGIAAERAR